MTDLRVCVTAGRQQAAAIFPPELRAGLARWATPVGSLADADVVVTGWGTSLVLDEETLTAAPRLRALVHAGGSVRRIVTPAVWERGLAVSSAADVNAGPVAEFAYAQIALAAKRALGAMAGYRPGKWPVFREREGADGRTVGVVGASRIGRRVLSRLRDAEAGYRVLLYDPYVSAADAWRLGAEPADIHTLCTSSSIVTLHAPELPETRHLLSAERLALLPDGATVVNTARGSLIDTDALVRECAAGRLDAFLDVTDPEPLPAGHPLFSLPNVFLTPHIAGCQGDEVRRLGVFAVDEVGRLARGEPLVGAVQREEWARMA
ncbi:hydroxyacid dehydrogenase [Streptomyces huiliensis]|uniref:hydroxyacid dehydrogenase n=1 Tax=Streptomyces huiliensis TaxID=2876027 RepID=UPI001CBF933C|nr:hydroxyacid dehydrogenase [Streptomyces huiliensis]